MLRLSTVYVRGGRYSVIVSQAMHKRSGHVLFVRTFDDSAAVVVYSMRLSWVVNAFEQV